MCLRESFQRRKSPLKRYDLASAEISGTFPPDQRDPTCGCSEPAAAQQKAIVIYEYQPTRKAEPAEHSSCKAIKEWLQETDTWDQPQVLPGNIRVVRCSAMREEKFEEQRFAQGCPTGDAKGHPGPCSPDRAKVAMMLPYDFDHELAPACSSSGLAAKLWMPAPCPVAK